MTDTPAAEPSVFIQVNEPIGVADAPGLTPPVVIGLAEAIAVADTPVAEPSVFIQVNEAIGVADAPGLTPPVVIGLAEAISVTDTPAAEPSVFIQVNEAIGVTDTPAAEPSVFIQVNEAVGVTDTPAVAPALLISVVEAIGVTDTPSVQLPVVINLVEAITVADAPQVVPPVVIAVTEAISVADDAMASVPDGDGDGVADAQEDAAPNGGDANDDGIPDRSQANVASLPDLGGADYLTIETGAGCLVLLDVTVMAESRFPVEDLAYDYPFGLLALRLPCTTATITSIFHGAASLGSPYRNFGPTLPGSPATAAWYTLSAALFGTTTIAGNTVATVTFTLNDGILGDDTATDGEIVSSGGPAVAAPPAIPMLSPVGRLILVLVIVAAPWLSRRPRRRSSGV